MTWRKPEVSPYVQGKLGKLEKLEIALKRVKEEICALADKDRKWEQICVHMAWETRSQRTEREKEALRRKLAKLQQRSANIDKEIVEICNKLKVNDL